MKKPEIISIDKATSSITDFANVLLRVETTSKCNRSCWFCPHSELKRPKENMNRDLYNKIINDASEAGINSMDIRNFGEPLLDKDLENKIKYAKDRGFKYVEIYTNGILLTPERYSSLCEAGITRIRTSLITDQEYNTTLLKNLADIKPKENIISIELINMPESMGNYITILRKLIDLEVTKVRIVPPHNWGDWTTENVDNSGKWCHRLWSSVNVLTNGQVVLCCMDYEGIYDLGNCNDQSIKEILNSDKFKEYRQNHLSGKLEPICEGCLKPQQDEAGLPIEVFLKGIEL
jgi:MoaA/NifB/PqqE/SkfB family radical SAM enzyme